MFRNSSSDKNDKIESVKQIFINSGSAEATKSAIENYTNKAFTVLETLNISEGKKIVLKQFGEQLIDRNV